MIADWQTNTVFFSDLLRSRIEYGKTCIQICDVLTKFNIRFHFLNDTKDIWARDYMPVQINEDKFIEYRYDPDYLQGSQKGFRDLKTYPDVVCETLNVKTIKSQIILDGGNVVRSENTVILKDKIVQENRNLFNRSKLIGALERTFEAEKIILIPWDRGEPYGHADGMLRFIDNGTVLINWVYRYSDNNFKNRILKALREKNILHEWLDLKVKKISRFNWAYINFLQTKDIILVPKFGSDEDLQAYDQIKNFYESYSYRNGIQSIESDQVARRGGAFNCITWTLKL